MEITGTVYYLERMAMPPTAEVHVALIDASTLDAVVRILAESTEPMGERQVPVAFALPLPEDELEAGTPCALRAEIRLDAQVQFHTPEPVPVPTAEEPVEAIDIRLYRAT